MAGVLDDAIQKTAKKSLKKQQSIGSDKIMHRKQDLLDNHDALVRWVLKKKIVARTCAGRYIMFSPGKIGYV